MSDAIWRPLNQIDPHFVKAALAANPVRACALLDALRIGEAMGFLHLLDMEVLTVQDEIKAVVWYDNWLKPWVAGTNWIPDLAKHAADRFAPIQQIHGPADTVEGLALAWSLGAPHQQQRFLIYEMNSDYLNAHVDAEGCRPARTDELLTIAKQEAVMIFEETGINPMDSDAHPHLMRVARGIDEQRYHVLEVDGVIRFQLALDSFGDNWGELAYGFTPTAFRKQGYAARGLGGISKQLLQRLPILFGRVRPENLAARAMHGRVNSHLRNWEYLEASWRPI